MNRYLSIIQTMLLLTGLFPALAAPIGDSLESMTLPRLEQRLEEIDTELNQLADYSLQGGVGAVGFRSDSNLSPDHPEWIQVELGKDTLIDQIVLVPTLWRTPKKGFTGDGFPVAFQIRAGTIGDTNGTLIATFTEEDNLLPRIAPLVIHFPETTAGWVHLETTTMSASIWNNLYVLQLAEMMVFSGQENVALHQPVYVSSKGYGEREAKHERFLVDGFVPYLINAAQGDRSIAFLSREGIDNNAALTIDLGAIRSINFIHLHATDLSDTIPQGTSNDYGIPRHLLVEGSNKPDFSDAVVLVEYKMESLYDAGPVIMRRFPETACRYVRLTALVPFSGNLITPTKALIAFAEIELFSDGENVALGRPVHANIEGAGPDRRLAALTDGLNFYGQILPLRTWMNQLAHRHDLEQERPLITAELSQRYTRQKTNLRRLGFLVALLAAGIVITILVERIIRLRQIALIKERFAADLHDELGANIHTIGLLSDAADLSQDSPDELTGLHQRIRALANRTGTAIRHCSNMLEADGLYFGLVEDMKRASERIMDTFEYSIEVEGEEYIGLIKPRTRVDLFLFYKECLINICRHSGATRFKARLIATPDDLCLTISDNGKGLSELPDAEIPPSLKRRARLLGAKLSFDRIENGGTQITLRLRTRKWWRKRKLPVRHSLGDGGKPNRRHTTS